MSLNFDLSRIADRETNYPAVTNEAGETIAWNPRTEAIIWSTIATDIGQFKDEAAAREAWRRYVVLGHNVEGGVTEDDFVGHVGLHTNVTTTGKRAFAAKVKRIEAQRKADAAWRAARRAERDTAAAVA